MPPSPEYGQAEARRTRPLHVRLSPAEHEQAHAKASRAGYSLSEYVRRFLHEWDGPRDEHADRLDALEAEVGDLQQRLRRVEDVIERAGR